MLKQRRVSHGRVDGERGFSLNKGIENRTLLKQRTVVALRTALKWENMEFKENDYDDEYRSAY